MLTRAEIAALKAGDKLFFRSRPRFSYGLPRVYDATVIGNRGEDTTVDLVLHYTGQDTTTILYYSGRTPVRVGLTAPDFFHTMPTERQIGSYEYHPRDSFARLRDPRLAGS